MAEHNDTGQKGEEIARKFLAAKGYKILATNWRFGKEEIDIIARHKDFIVIVEVKTRSSAFLSEPDFTVNRNKQRLLVKAANAFLTQKNIDLEARFDIISVLLLPNQPTRIEHLEDAFYPMLG